MTKRNKHRNLRSSRRGRSRQDGTKLKKYLLLGGVPITVISSISVGLAMIGKTPQADLSGCYAQVDQHEHAIVLDNSFTKDASPAQLRAFRARKLSDYDELPANARISVFTSALGDGGPLAEPVFTICKPAETIEQQISIGGAKKPAPYLKRHAEEARIKYGEAVDQILGDAKDASKAALDSPILEQLRDVSRHKYFSSKNRSLTLITDGVQNSEVARFCVVKGDMPSFSTFRKRRDYPHVEPLSFEGAKINLLLVEFGQLPAPNAPFCTNHEVRSWWPSYFKGNGAESVTPYPIRFGAEG